MTECDPPKIRSLIEKHLGKDKAKEYDTIVEQCKLGQAMKDKRVWAPLCPAYPNLKGVTCDEVDEFTHDKETTVPEYIFTNEHTLMVSDMMRRYYDDEMDEDKFRKEYLSNVVKNMDSTPTNAQVSAIEGAATNMMWTSTDYSEEMKTYDSDFYYNTFYKREHEEPVDKKYRRDYISRVRVYDRDEEYTAFKKIGEQIEKDMPGVLHDFSTIFVTTPRGGHEMLSIFAYANNIKKNQIPSDISWKHVERDGYNAELESYFRQDPHRKLYDDVVYDTEIFGKTWLGDRSKEIKHVFIVDDIIASGHQMGETAVEIEAVFPGVPISSVTLCKRANRKYRAVQKYYTDTSTTGIERFDRDREKGKLSKEYITCLFPHACPDGSSDKLVIEMMGSRRCSPDKRLSKRDL